MRESVTRRYLWSAVFALGAGLLVAVANPAPVIKADLKADARGVVFSVQYAERELVRLEARA